MVYIRQYHRPLVRLYPEVRKLDRKIHLTRKSFLNKMATNVSVTGLCLGTCLALGMPTDILKSVGSITYLSQSLIMLLEAYNSGSNSDMKQSDVYFLWKVNDKRSAQLNS